MGMVMGVTGVILGIGAALVGLMLWMTLLFPRPTARARRKLEERPGRCFLAGLGMAVLLGVPVIALLRSPNGLAKLGGWTLAFPLTTLLAVGLAAMAQLLGERMQALSPSVTPLGALVRGALTLELVALLPFFGWFLFTPLVSLTLLGAGVIGCLGKSSEVPERHGDTGSLNRDRQDTQDTGRSHPQERVDESPHISSLPSLDHPVHPVHPC
jgi:hypothetical protein